MHATNLPFSRLLPNALHWGLRMSELWYTDFMAKIDLRADAQRQALEAFWNTTYKVNADGTFAVDDNGQRIRTSHGKVLLRPCKGCSYPA